MSTLSALFSACGAQPQMLLDNARQQAALWDKWLAPVRDDAPEGEDISYDDDFQAIRDEVNKLSGVDVESVAGLSEKLLIHSSKDLRVAAFWCWSRLQQEGESGLAQGLTLIAALLSAFPTTLHPQRARPRKAALEWLASGRMLDTLTRWPEVTRHDFELIVGALALMAQITDSWPENEQPALGALYSALENRMAQSGGPQAVVPQTNRSEDPPALSREVPVSGTGSVSSGRELMEQARLLAGYLRNQQEGWLAGNHLMKSVRWDTLYQLPPLDAAGRTRLMPPKPEYRAQLKRLFLQQSWLELIEQADRMFAEGVNHLWLDLQWYLHQALGKAGAPYALWADIILYDLKGLLSRLKGLEGLAYSDGTAFADEVTLNWINQRVLDSAEGWGNEAETPTIAAQDDILLLEPEALTLADKEGVDAALGWLQTRQGAETPRNRWLLRLLMARIAEQYGKHDLAMHLLAELDGAGVEMSLTQWEPDLLFEVKARALRLIRIKAGRSESDKQRLQPQMEALLAGLIRLDPARAAVLCG
ncbi:type VI secretion system protein TssA [Erwinia sp. HR93]|uniref:type VI secretion system protein TssA n=1 Tax=Erwinia sp. HR93 TaxID=3094840 RepID=UPI002ADEE85C|nr:type VI secretion system protein TssA [Erwinia sp. HR93]MEA1064777.1 type VI secretion system protein TssA [Erwinia sp. HR93]